MKSQTFEHEMTQTSSVFGRKKELKVIFKGDGAATDGKNVYLPSISHEKEVDVETQMVMRGYVDHEGGHNRHSDMPLTMETYKRWLDEGKPVLKGLHNAIEDMWLEKRVMREYAGSEKNLSAVATSCNEMFFEENNGSDDPALQSWASVGPLAVTWEGRRAYDGIKGVDECMSLIPEELQAKVKEWVSRIHDCANTAETIKLAVEIYYGDIKDAERKRKDGGGDGTGEPKSGADEDGGSGGEPSDGDKDDSDSSRRSDAEDGTKSTDEGGVDEDDADEDDSEASAGEEEEGEDTGARTDAEGGGGTEPDEVTPLDFDLRRGLDGTLKAAGLTGHDGKHYRLYTTEYDRVCHRTLKDGPDADDVFCCVLSSGNQRMYTSEKNKLGDTINVMGRKLARAFMAKQDRFWEGGREHGRLDSRRLVAAVSGQVNVFKRREEAQDIDTAVQILVDMSGSMDRYGKIQLARQAAIALCECLVRTTVAFELIGFTTFEKAISRDEQLSAMRKKYSRYSPIRHIIFKSFEETLRDARAAIGTLAGHHMHHNVDGEAILFAHERLRKRPEKRRILMVMSDGLPEFNGFAGGRDHRRSHLRDAIAHAQKGGTELVGIGITSDAVKQFYERYAVVMNINDLSKGALDQLARLLIDDNFDVTSGDLIKASKLG